MKRKRPTPVEETEKSNKKPTLKHTNESIKNVFVAKRGTENFGYNLIDYKNIKSKVLLQCLKDPSHSPFSVIPLGFIRGQWRCP